ncbi:MAG: DUF3810 domain-containing protein [Clostridia bacterium]
MAKDTEQKSSGVKRLILRALWLLLIPFGLWLPTLASRYPDIVERYFSRGAYPYISGALAGLTSSISASVAEIIVILAVLFVVCYLLGGIFKLFMRKIRVSDFLSRIVSLGIIAGILLNLFYVCWGFNYYRPSLYTLMQLPVRERSVDELESLCKRLAEESNELRLLVDEDTAGVFTPGRPYEDCFDELPSAYSSLSKKINVIVQKAYPAKAVYFSNAMSYTGIAGIFFPYTGEPNVNVDQPPLLALSSAAHEMAHFQGIAREDEANFIAYLACMESSDPAIRYSGAMLALINCGNKLYAADENKYFAISSSYSDEIVRDIKNYNAYWKAFDGPIEKFSTELNDSYLKFNQQENGVRSYGMMVDLLLAYYSQPAQ